MTAMTTAPFTAARVQGRYRVLDEAGQIVVTLNSKAKAEARAAELNEAATTVAEADNMAEIDAALATLDTATAEEPKQGPSPEAVATAVAQLQAELDANADAIGAVLSEPLPGEVTETVENWGPDPVVVTREFDTDADYQAELDAQAAARAAQEPQDAPQADAGTSDTPPAPEAPQKPAKAPKAGQPEPHAFTTVGTTIKNHCTDCGRSWAAAAHRKFREAQPEAVAAVEEEWTPAADDTTASGEAPALDGQPAEG